MVGIWDHQGPNRAGSTSNHDPFTNVIEVRITISGSLLQRLTANQRTQQLDDIDLIDLTGADEFDSGQLQQTLRVNKSLRNYALDGDHNSVTKVVVDGTQYDVGHFVELRELVGTHDVSDVKTALGEVIEDKKTRN